MTRFTLALLAAFALLLVARPSTAAAKESATAAVKAANDKLRSALDAYSKAKGEAPPLVANPDGSNTLVLTEAGKGHQHQTTWVALVIETVASPS